ncbi:MAG: T9SS type A sorting domain-containing protein [Ignavibacteria bacterium]
MKKLVSVFSILFALLFISTAAQSQVSVSGSTGADGTYTSLTSAAGAFEAINSGSQTGNSIVISITNDALTETGANSLDAGTWTSLTISPSGGAGRTISGSNAGPLINLNGADNITIDGLNSGGNSLTIVNTSTGASSTIKFIADATNNVLTNCTVQGSSSTAANGVIFFSTGAATGNDGNNINNCIIGPAGANLPINGIYSLGTSAAVDNSGNTINANNISDYFTATITTSGATAGINLAATGNSAWTISDNKLFQTTNKTFTVSNGNIYGIFVGTGSGYTITGNTVGYANASGTGTSNYLGITTPGTFSGTFPSSYSVGTATLNSIRYTAINCAFTAAGSVSSIQNNTIGGFAILTSSGANGQNGVLCGIAVTSGNVNIGTTTGNTIGSTSGNGSFYTAVSTTGGTIVGIYTLSNNTANIQNNSIGAFDAMGTSVTSSGSITAINTTGSGIFNVTSNTIGNSTNPNMRTGNLTEGGNLSNTGTTFSIASGNSAFKGIANTTTGTNLIGTNVIRNASINSSSTSAVFRGIEQTSSTGTTTITDNSINNITSASANVTLSTAGLGGLGILISGNASGTTVTQNTINTLSLNNAVSTGTNIGGIGIASSSNLSITNNIIYDISNASTSVSTTAPGSVSGIFIRSGGLNSPINVFNNMITLGNSQTTNTCFVGIWGNHGQTNNPVTNIYYNSVYITGTATSGAQPSFGYLRGDMSLTARTATVDVRNNILNNDRTGGTGKHYAISNNYGTTASSIGWGTNASNFNVLNSASASTVGYWTTDQTFATWKTASSSDAISLTAIPVTFANFATGDLHLNMGLTPTQLESGGIVISDITTDIDGTSRPGPPGSVNGGATSPDIGADEFDGVPLDLTPPNITYNLLLGSSCYTSRDLTAIIFDGLGLNVTPGLKPRIYYKKSSNSNVIPSTNDNTTDGWKYAEASNTSSPFNFTIDYSITFGGVASGDVIEYFVVAQDTATIPNVGIFSGTFATTPASVNLTTANLPTGVINSYNLLTGLSGIVTIGASGTYTTLTDASGLFAAINTNGISGNLIAEILDANISENGLNSLNAIQYGCSSALSLVIRPATGVTTLISGTHPSALIDLNNADYVTFDGSNNGSSSKDITIRNTGAGSTIRFINGATFDTVRSCIIESQNTSSSSGTILFSTSNGTTGNSNIVIQGCDIRDRSDITGVPANGVYSAGSDALPNSLNKISGCNVFNWTISGVSVSAAGAGDGWVINPSSFYQTASRTTNLKAISIKGGNGHSILNNIIGGSDPSGEGSFIATTNGFTGIELTAGTTSATSIQGNTIMNIRSSGQGYGINITAGMVNIGNVTGNTIGSSDVNKRIDFFSTSSGIISNSTSTVNISNNILNNFNVTGNGTGFNGALTGIDCSANTAGLYTVVNNSITNLTCNGTSNTFDGASTTIGISVNVKGVNTVRGNTISDIGNINTTNSNPSKIVTGLNCDLGMPGTVVENNKIINLYASSSATGAVADQVTGFKTGQFSNITFSNNIITLSGGVNPSNRNVTGIIDGSINSGVMNFYYNSVHIYGTSTGSNNTYAFLRSGSVDNITLRNNVFANSRVATTGSNVAMANDNSTPVTGWPSSASNYNALYSLNNATTRGLAESTLPLAGFQNISGGDSYTLVGDPGFTSNTNLLPDASNINNWVLKGNGIAISTISTDIIGTPRSISVMTGGTDVGAYEFSTSVQPPVYNNATPAPGVYKFIHKLDTMATVNVIAAGSLADVNVQYYSGENPPGLDGDPTVTDGYGNVYWEVHPTDNSNAGYTYDITLHYSPALTGTITNEENIKVAKNTNNDTLYIPFTVSGTGPGEYQLDTAKNNITVYGLTAFSRFILTDGSAPLPVELTAFTSAVERRDVKLNWTTSSETNNSGFDVERKSSNGEWKKITNVNGSGTTNSPKNYTYADKNLASGKYEYRLKQIDFNGHFTYFNLSSEVNVGVPAKFDLSQNYPNPFNPVTKINFDIPADGKVNIRVYDISGREVVTLVNEIRTAGYYTVDFNGSQFASGTYFYRITAEGNGQNFVATKKMVLIK